MNWIDHEYLVPVIIGNGAESISTAKKIYKLTKKRVHLFAQSFSLLQRIQCVCHKVDPWRDFLIVESLAAFAQSLEGYFYPVVIVCKGDTITKNLIEKHSDILESHYLVVKSEDI